MNTLVSKLKKEMSELNSDVDVHSFYKYNLNPIYFNHDINFNSKYDDKPAFIPHSDYNGNKFNLERQFDEPIIHYKADNFTPDTYYQYNLQNTDHEKMMLNNLETENEIGNEFNRRTRESDSGQPLQEIKKEDDERAQNLKKLLDEFNNDIRSAESVIAIEEVSDNLNKNIDKINVIKDAWNINSVPYTV